MFAAGQLMGRVLPSVTTPVTLFTASVATEITMVVFAMTSGAPASVKYALYHDQNGTTYDNTTVIGIGEATDTLFTFSPGAAFLSHGVGSGIHMLPGESLGVEIDSASAINVTAYGITAHIDQV